MYELFFLLVDLEASTALDISQDTAVCFLLLEPQKRDDVHKWQKITFLSRWAEGAPKRGQAKGVGSAGSLVAR